MPGLQGHGKHPADSSRWAMWGRPTCPRTRLRVPVQRGRLGRGGDSCCPRQPLPGPGDPGTGREPQPICARAVVPAEPLCYLILVFEGESQHLASLVRLVPWGTPRGSRVLGCPR